MALVEIKFSFLNHSTPQNRKMTVMFGQDLKDQ